MTSDPKLRRWLLDFNRKWFSGELPVDRVTALWEPPGPDLGECGIAEGSIYKLDEAEFAIKINPALMGMPTVAKVTLLHECVHLKLCPNMGHGKRFQQEMLSLAERGALRKLW